jgi:hypothetical protein
VKSTAAAAPTPIRRAAATAITAHSDRTKQWHMAEFSCGSHAVARRSNICHLNAAGLYSLTRPVPLCAPRLWLLPEICFVLHMLDVLNKALFRSNFFLDFDSIAFLFLFDKYYLNIK